MILLIRNAAVFLSIRRRPVAGIVPALPTLHADELARTRQQGKAQLRQLVPVRLEPLLLRLDTPVLILPQVDIQLPTAVQCDLPLLEALAPAV